MTAILSACSTPAPKPVAPVHKGRAQYQRIPEPPGTHHYTLAPGQSWTAPKPRRHPDPVYPPALVERTLPPVRVVARLSVDKVGRVTAVYISDNDAPAADRAAFGKAVRNAAMRWSFSPMKFTTTITHGDAPPRILVAAKPFSMWFRFRFEVVNGKPVTSSRRK